MAALAATVSVRSSQQPNHLRTEARGGQGLVRARVLKSVNRSSARLGHAAVAYWRMLPPTGQALVRQ